MTDRELLELAAKAAGLKIDKSPYNGGGRGNTGFDMVGNAVLDWHNNETWNPLADDGDALRLAVKLDFSIEQNIAFHRSCVLAYIPGQKSVFATEFFELWANDKQAATRRAIVRAAAEFAMEDALQSSSNVGS